LKRKRVLKGDGWLKGGCANGSFGRGIRLANLSVVEREWGREGLHYVSKRRN